MNMDATHDVDESGIEEIEQVRAFWRDHGTKVTVVAAVVAVVVVGGNLYKARQQRRRVDASAQLSAVRSTEELEAIVENYGSTPSAPLAVLQLALGAYDSGNFNRSLEHYELFIDRYSSHELVSVAELGSIHCREARGELQAAEEAFKTFAAEHPKHFLTAQALVGQARCLEQLGRFDDARVVHENIVATHGDSLWGDQATVALESLEDRRETYNNPPPPVPVMPELSIPDAFTAPVGEVEAKPIAIQ